MPSCQTLCWLSTASLDLPYSPARGHHHGGFACGQLHATLRTWFLHHDARNACPEKIFGRLRLHLLHEHLSHLHLRIVCGHVIADSPHSAAVRTVAEANMSAATALVSMTVRKKIVVRHLYSGQLRFRITTQLFIVFDTSRMPYSQPALALKMHCAEIFSGS